MGVRDAINRLLERANAEGRTAIRCAFCQRQISRLDCNCARPWVDDYGLATCPARSLDRFLAPRALGHQPASERSA